jgi:hypothetical protein
LIENNTHGYIFALASSLKVTFMHEIKIIEQIDFSRAVDFTILGIALSYIISAFIG